MKGLGRNKELYKSINNVLKPYILESGAVLTQKLHQEKNIEYKADDNPVTDLDKFIESQLAETILTHYPDHGILAEEAGILNVGSNEYHWIIDPIDGTINFVHGIPLFSISLAMLHQDKVVLGIIYDPVRDEYFSAIDNTGIYLNQEKVTASKCHSLNKAVIGVSFSYLSETESTDFQFMVFQRFMNRSQSVRRIGSTALMMAWVACGRLDGFWVFGNKPWDYMAGNILIKESGGKCTGTDGGEIDHELGNICAGNRHIHKEMLQVING